MTAKKRKKNTRLDLAGQQLFFHAFAVFALKMDKPKKKPCSITPQERAKQYPGKFHADDNPLFCSTCNVVVDHNRKSVLDNHFSAVSHIKQMNESPSKRAKKQTVIHSSTTSKFGEKYVICKICKKYEKFKNALNALIQPLIFTSNCYKKPLVIRLIN